MIEYTFLSTGQIEIAMVGKVYHRRLVVNGTPINLGYRRTVFLRTGC